MSATVEPSSVGILLVEEAHSRIRAASRILGRAGFTVTVARSCAHAMSLLGASEIPFDAAVLRHRLPDGVSLPLVEVLSRAEPSCSCLVLTARNEHAVATQYRTRGAFRCVSTPISDPQLLAHVHATVMDSHRWRQASAPATPVGVPPVVVVDFEAAAERLRYLANLSPTERDVAYWLLQGLRDAQIAHLLGRAERTAKRHVGQVLAKAGVPNRASLWAVLRNDSELQIIYSARGRGDGDPDPDDEPDPRPGSKLHHDNASHP